MIDEKKINKAMSSYATETFNHIEERFAAMCGFKEGAEWAQKEFVKSLWHDKDGSPSGRDRRTAWCLVEVETTSLSHSRKLLYVTARRLRGNWDQSAFSFLDEDPRVVCYEIKRWCYLSDLLPKEGGEGCTN